MATKSRDEILGTEYDWLASDGAGFVGLFTTAGGSYAPDEFLRDTDEHARAIDAILAIPPSTVARFAPELDAKAENIWREAAERGIFAFDGNANGGPYTRVAAPRCPVRIDELPLEIAAVARRMVFSNLSFIALDKVTTEALEGSDD